MQVKVFEAKDMTSGLKMIKDELGSEALIISTKTIKSGKFGMGKSGIEITAAVTPAPLNAGNNYRPNKTSISQMPPRKTNQRTTTSSSYGQLTDERNSLFDNDTNRYEAPSNQPYQNAIPPRRARQNSSHNLSNQTNNHAFNTQVSEQTTNHHFTPPQEPAVSINSAFNNHAPNNNYISSDMEDLKNIVKNLAGEISRMQTGQPATQNTASSKHQEPIFDLLRSKGINEEISHTISNFLQSNIAPQELENPIELNKHTTESIQSMIEVAPPFKYPKGEQQRIAFVGPTGVGKTTTLAKLAASRISNGTSSIAMITIDTYRIAAVEQLKVYGEIMNVPVEVVLSPDQLEHSLIKHRDCDLILIDTAGRSPKDSLSIDDLANFLKPDLNIENHLVLSATAREEEMIDTMTRFNKLNIHSTIYTKIDECSQLGALLNVQSHNNNPISCLTNGQRVPEDILDISSQRVAELIMSAN
ncbi:MAG: flagellar biosynthesis protein FlhF [Desulfotalea sp.]